MHHTNDIFHILQSNFQIYVKKFCTVYFIGLLLLTDISDLLPILSVSVVCFYVVVYVLLFV